MRLSPSGVSPNLSAPYPMQRLSSQLSLVTKYLAPTLFFVAALIVLSGGLLKPDPGPWPAVLFTALSLFTLWWVWPIRTVTLGGEKFILSDLRRSCEVPVAHLVEIHEHRWNRTPNIVLIFDPPTPFGRKVRLVTPSSLFGGEFRRVADLLGGVLIANRAARADALETMSRS